MAEPVPHPMTLAYRQEDGARLASLLWEFGPGWRMISSAVLGGGIGPREWVLNAQVASGYARLDPADHLRELGPGGSGVGMMTVAYADRYVRRHDGGVEAVATVGLRRPTWAAAPPDADDPELEPRGEAGSHGGPSADGARDAAATVDAVATADAVDSGRRAPAPGTINIVVVVPVAMSDAALVNAVMTVTEAKTQALVETGFPGTGTASDAVCVAVRQDGPEEIFGGPRSVWGARIARAVHAAVRDGVHEWHRGPRPR
ncbi:adenosylcobinamide amidohydrolase [Thermopolyspora sp. NPDC052614]|uniref:adenosylcobinamide amidohydrolase n=1 Tax=Thermopolyspora sp. NPDC052614 TaxID=3155682 RepID=UPI003416AA30